MSDLRPVDYLLIGHVAVDLTPSGKQLGGTVSYAALTAKAMPDDQARCLAAGANDYIAKPLDIEMLLSLIRVWMPK